MTTWMVRLIRFGSGLALLGLVVLVMFTPVPVERLMRAALARLATESSWASRALFQWELAHGDSSMLTSSAYEPSKEAQAL